jgi:hypothetical protein
MTILVTRACIGAAQTSSAAETATPIQDELRKNLGSISESSFDLELSRTPIFFLGAGLD